MVSTEETLDVRADVIADALAAELRAEFAAVMSAWGFRPFRRGQVALPTLEEAERVVGTSRYLGA
jgi:hypothetical protein